MRATATTKAVSAPLRRSARLMSSMNPDTKAINTMKTKKSSKDKPQTLIMSKKPVKTVVASKIKPDTCVVKGSPVFNQTLSREMESRFIAKGYSYVVGVDEAGRGPLAGPVVAAACYIPSHVHIEGINDSKKLDENQREFLFKQLTTHKDIIYSVHVGSVFLFS
jgi:ribonuclease HIII